MPIQFFLQFLSQLIHCSNFFIIKFAVDRERNTKEDHTEKRSDSGVAENSWAIKQKEYVEFNKSMSKHSVSKEPKSPVAGRLQWRGNLHEIWIRDSAMALICLDIRLRRFSRYLHFCNSPGRFVGTVLNSFCPVEARPAIRLDNDIEFNHYCLSL